MKIVIDPVVSSYNEANHDERINKKLLSHNHGVSKLLSDLENYDLYLTEDDSVIEEDDGGGVLSLYDMLFIKLIPYGFEYTKKYLKSDEYLDELKSEYILKKDGSKITLDAFVEYLYLDNELEEYRLIGDEPIVEEL